MDEEIRNLQLDKPGQGKTALEMQKHTIDENQFENKPIERSIYILSKGDETQKLSVISSLPDLIRQDSQAVINKILPRISQELINASSEFNLTASKTFSILMHNDAPVTVITQILQGIENRDPMTAKAWMDTLISVIPIAREPILKNEILKCATVKSQLSKGFFFRVSSCKILGKIAVHKCMTPFEVKRDILPLVQSLCQDCFHEVRAAMCKELPNIAQGLNGNNNVAENVIKNSVLPLLVELFADENMYVRTAVIESVVQIIPFLHPDTVKASMISLCKKICSKTLTDGDGTYSQVAKNFGKLLGNLQTHLTLTDALWFLDYYCHICKKGLSVVPDDMDVDPAVTMAARESCAYCLPTVLNVVLSILPNEINTKWYITFKHLCGDPCYLVRKAVAVGFAQMVKLLGPANKLLFSEFTKLLRDEDEEVLEALVPNIGFTLELFALTGILPTEQPVQSTIEVGKALIKCQVECFRFYNWRLKEAILKQLEMLPYCMPSDFIHQHFTPIALSSILLGKAKPIRTQGARTLIVFLRYCLKENHRKWITDNIYTQLCCSGCCYTRQMYIVLCQQALTIFSWKYFKEHFYMPLLGLADDKISNVRLLVVKLCPILKQMLVLPVDRPLQIKLENALSKLEMMESDKDVLVMLKLKLKEMRSFQIHKTDVVLEERRRIEEEENILKGKFTLNVQLKPDKAQSASRTQQSITAAVTNKKESITNIQMPKILSGRKQPEHIIKKKMP